MVGGQDCHMPYFLSWNLIGIDIESVCKLQSHLTSRKRSACWQAFKLWTHRMWVEITIFRDDRLLTLRSAEGEYNLSNYFGHSSLSVYNGQSVQPVSVNYWIKFFLFADSSVQSVSVNLYDDIYFYLLTSSPFRADRECQFTQWHLFLFAHKLAIPCAICTGCECQFTQWQSFSFADKLAIPCGICTGGECQFTQ